MFFSLLSNTLLIIRPKTQSVIRLPAAIFFNLLPRLLGSLPKNKEAHILKNGADVRREEPEKCVMCGAMV